MKYLKGPQNNADPNDRGGYAALQAGAAVVDHAESKILRLTGRDPIGMLNAVLTNDVPTETDRGAYAALLNPKGRVQTDLRVIKDPSGEAVFIVTGPEGASAVKEILGRYAPFSRVRLEDLSGWTVLGFYGPDPATIRDAHDLAEHESAEVEIDGIKLLTVGVATPVPGFEHIGPAGMTRAAREHLIGAGAAPAGRDAYETARIAAGIPRFGADITPDNFPGESEHFLERAVSFGKGCYPGQETVARMHYRGSPNKKLYRFELEPGPIDERPEAGDEILQDGGNLAGPISPVDVVGWLTSVAPLPGDGRIYALGYLARKADLESPLRAGDAKILALRPA